MKLCLLTDTHYTINGTWEDTARNIRSVAESIKYDAIVHLGDFTDGMLPKRLTRKYVENMILDLESCGTPLYIVPGNHDSNYFGNRRNTFSDEEMRRLYRLRGEERRASTNKISERNPVQGTWADPLRSNENIGQDMNEEYTGLDYFVDVPEFSLRMIFLSSFEDTVPIRYGYTDGQLQWLKEVLHAADPGTKFLIFSHDAPLAKLDYWSFHICNGERLLDILEECNASEQYQVAGFFYGHTHADYVYDECSFPVISTGCAKLEYFTDKKPRGAVAWPREADTATQDLWDSVLIDFDRQRLKLIRFGAGVDRVIYSSFNHYSMRKVLRLLPGARVAFLYSNGILDIADYAKRHGGYAVHPSVKKYGISGCGQGMPR